MPPFATFCLVVVLAKGCPIKDDSVFTKEIENRKIELSRGVQKCQIWKFAD